MYDCYAIPMNVEIFHKVLWYIKEYMQTRGIAHWIHIQYMSLNKHFDKVIILAGCITFGTILAQYMWFFFFFCHVH